MPRKPDFISDEKGKTVSIVRASDAALVSWIVAIMVGKTPPDCYMDTRFQNIHREARARRLFLATLLDEAPLCFLGTAAASWIAVARHRGRHPVEALLVAKAKAQAVVVCGGCGYATNSDPCVNCLAQERERVIAIERKARDVEIKRNRAVRTMAAPRAAQNLCDVCFSEYNVAVGGVDTGTLQMCPACVAEVVKSAGITMPVRRLPDVVPVRGKRKILLED